MKRSEVNRYQKEALEFIGKTGFHLPEWAAWRPADWQKRGGVAGEIKRRRLGWDITDFNEGRFGELGVILFTLRNGPPDGAGQPYCEKIIVMRKGQKLPTHFHWKKTEDIINRGGADMIIKLWNSDESENPAGEAVTVMIDGGIIRKVDAGEELAVPPGGSITLTPGMYHCFYPKDGNILIGEVSSVNDDINDNRTLEPMPRFSEIEEDEEILYYLCNEYP